MGDWERTFGQSGMANGGMGIVDEIVNSERREARHSARLRFDTWAEANSWAKANPGNTVIRNPNGPGYATKYHPKSIEPSEGIPDARQSEARKKIVAITIRAMDLVQTWPSTPQGVIFMKDLITYRDHQICFDTDSATIYVRAGEETIGAKSYVDFDFAPEHFRAQVDCWLDAVGAQPASYVRPFGPLRPPPMDGDMALNLIASWPSAFSYFPKDYWGEVYYREFLFSHDPCTSNIRIRTLSDLLEKNEYPSYLAEIPVTYFQECQRFGYSFRNYVEGLLDNIGIGEPRLKCNFLEWQSHPIREAFLFIAGEESPWAVAPPATLFRGHTFSIYGDHVSLDDGHGDPAQSFSVQQIRGCGSIKLMMRRLMRSLHINENLAEESTLHYEREKRFTY